jgi:hypothetical protein
VSGIGDHAVAGPAADVAGDELTVAEGLDGGGRGDEVDEPSDHPGVDGVVVGVDAHVVVPGQPDPMREPDLRVHRRQRGHGLTVGLEHVHRPPADRSDRAGVRPSCQPLGELVVEVRRGREVPPRQERGLEEAVVALHHPLELRIPRRGQPDPRGQCAGERRRDGRKLPGATDGRLPVPDQRLTHPPQPADQRPHAPEQISALARGQPWREGSIVADTNRENAKVMTSTGSTRACPAATGTGVSGNHRSH